MKKNLYIRISMPFILILPLLFALISGCSDKLEMPVDQGGLTGSGDTAFIKLNPSWDAAFGLDLSEPSDIIIGPDGLVYIADKGNDRIMVVNRSGVPQTFGGLDDIGEVETPSGLAFDDMLNLFICNNTETVYIWNRYLNNYDVVAVAQEYVLMDTLSGDTIHLNDAGDMLEYIIEQPDPDCYWVLIDSLIDWDYSAEAINQVLQLREFYTSPASQFHAVAVDPIAGNTIYLTDPAKQRIYRVRVTAEKMVWLSNGYWGYSYRAEPLGVALSYGTGILTCDQPQGITFDSQGYMLFSQTGGNFKVQKIAQNNFAAFVNFGFNDSSDVMIEGRFADPLDVCVGKGTGLGTGWIYVADTDSNRVQIFEPDGYFIMYAGFRPLPVDTTLIDTIITQLDSVTFDTNYVYNDTIIILEVNDQLDHPEGIAVFDGVLYISDTASDRIERYGLSASEGDLPGGEF